MEDKLYSEAAAQRVAEVTGRDFSASTWRDYYSDGRLPGAQDNGPARIEGRRRRSDGVDIDRGHARPWWRPETVDAFARRERTPGRKTDHEGARTVRYTTNRDAIEQAILPALGDHADDYDVDAIFREAFEYRVDTDKDGNELLNTAGFEQVVSDDEFWAIAAKHDKTA